ncbi:response regulator transcription factor [Arthrobacter sp. HY1533]|uniref:response regulator transcription factor n=1 Tax=Arthrobacter sp. HY1533 TaxID=2970919 RepID=UPI0022B9DD75|nr:response regulator transcription factor [Arthrobacter sp. HY1533]
MPGNVIRVGIVDDNEVVRIGFSAGAALEAKISTKPVKVIGEASTVRALLQGPPNMFDVVVLDLSLSDGSRPGENVRAVLAAGYPVLVFSIGDNSDDIREALAAGASGISRKSEEIRTTLELVRLVAAGQTIDNQELAAAISADPAFLAAELSDRERETLRYYATGFTRGQIATRMNISANTVGTNIKRIREKYAAAGRFAPTKLELYHRALEDGVVTAEVPRP